MPPSNADSSQGPMNGMVRKLVSRRRILTVAGAVWTALGLGGGTGSAVARRSRKGRYRPGVPVIDGDDSNPDAAIVINSLDVAISDWTVFGTETVADQNPTYNPEEPVVVVAFEQLLDDGWPDWRRAKPDALFDGVVERGVKFHAFPKARLDRGRPKGGGKHP